MKTTDYKVEGTVESQVYLPLNRNRQRLDLHSENLF